MDCWAAAAALSATRAAGATKRWTPVRMMFSGLMEYLPSRCGSPSRVALRRGRQGGKDEADRSRERRIMTPMPDLSLRPATAADGPALAALAERLGECALPDWRTPHEIADADARAMLEAVADGDPDNEVLIAERDGAVAGCLHILAVTDFFGLRHGHVSVLATTSAAEGSGVAVGCWSLGMPWPLAFGGWSFSSVPVEAHSQLLHHLWRASRPLGHVAVAHVLQVVDPHLAGEEPARREIAEAVEEGDAVREPRLRFLRPGDLVEHLGALRGSRRDKILLEPADALAIEPRQPAAHRRLPPRLVGHHEVHELRHAGVGGAARAFVLRDDQVDQQPDRRILMRREELRLE